MSRRRGFPDDKLGDVVDAVAAIEAAKDQLQEAVDTLLEVELPVGLFSRLAKAREEVDEIHQELFQLEHGAEYDLDQSPSADGE